jgi:RecA/RadA recombinase
MAVAKKRRGVSRAQVLANEINDTLKIEGRKVTVGSDPYFLLHRIPTGSLVMDRITGNGFVLGRHYEMYGDENSGKSYIVYKTMALSQSRGKRL